MTANILFSTTRMWNCGDDFILFGIRNLIREIMPDYNPVAYNRNPELHQFRTFNRQLTLNVPGATGPVQVDLAAILQNKTWLLDNSWRPQHDISAIDYCIFAGTPEWFGPMVAPMVSQLLETDIPVAYLGIGIFEGSRNIGFSDFPEQDSALLQRARLITARDKWCTELLEPVNASFLPCPALFSAPESRERKQKRKLALSTQGTRPGNGQAIDRKTLDYSVSLFRKLTEYYDCTLVCHYIDELIELKPLLGDVMPLMYSYDARDYIELYDRFDISVTTRVHGAGICASLGIPSAILAHSARSDTAAGFMAKPFEIENTTSEAVLEWLDKLDIGQESRRLIEHKETTRSRYMELLKPFFGVF